MVKASKEDILKLMHTQEKIRNIGIIAHIDHGKSTLSDSLLAGAGMLSTEIAGTAVATDTMEEEQQRGITIQTTNVTMVHKFEDEHYLINLLDTPGHVDFGGDVTRAMRAVDGAVVLVDAVEGVMPQTENVLRQALKERVKPVLFINKVDRFIKEIKLTPEKMQERFLAIIKEVNEIIEGLAPKEFKEKWQVSVQDGSVAFGSGYHNWALSLKLMQKKNMGFKEILDAYQSEEYNELKKQIPAYEAVLNMVIMHLPDPRQAQKYRIKKLWHGEMESDIGKSLINCNADGPLVGVVTKVVVDPQAGEIACLRLFSGTLNKGVGVHLNNAHADERIQQIAIFKADKREIIDNAIAGNIIAVSGLKTASSGETVSTEEITPFEAITHLFEPVVTKAIEAKNPADLPKLIEALKQMAKEDPTIKIEINQETGENLISGLGELHLEIKEHILERDKGLKIVSTPPIVVYRETVQKKAGPIEGKSPNKHNKLYVVVEPLDTQIYKAIKAGDIPEIRIKKKKKEISDALIEAGMDRDESKQVVEIYKGNILVEATRGIVHIGEIIEMVMEAFEEVSKAGPMAKEPGYALKVTLTDAKLHEDSIHRGPGQIIPCMRKAIFNAMLVAGDILYEPIQTTRIDAPMEFLGNVSKLIQSRRGQLLNTEQEGDQVTVTAKLPVAEMFGFTSALRSATTGRGSSSLIDQSFEKVPTDMQEEVVRRIRKRKGLPDELPRPDLE